jgi:8-amino-7-oxononanoate synthase
MHQLEQQGLLRTRVLCSPKQIDVIHFDKNDYLSLAEDLSIAQYYIEGYQNHPSGSGGSMLVSGYYPIHQETEQEFAAFLNTDACIIYSSGYAANLAITALLGQLKAHCFIDKGIHASIYDGLHLSGTPYTRYMPHNLEHLSQLLKKDVTHPVIYTEGIFSMTGQIAPLDGLAGVCQKIGATLLVDEAHSFGVLGDGGRGAVSAFGLTQNEVPLRIIPLGKAFGTQGAVVAGRSVWIKALLQAGRSLTYSTAINPALTYGIKKTLNVVATASVRRQRLMHLIDYFRGCILHSSKKWVDSKTPIQFLQLGCPHRALDYSKVLEKKGLRCTALRAPTVSKKATGLRVVLNYHHTKDQIKQLIEAINDYDTY